MGQQRINSPGATPGPRDRHQVALDTAMAILDDDAGDDALTLAAGQLVMTHAVLSETHALHEVITHALSQLQQLADKAGPLLDSPAAKLARGANRLRTLVAGNG